MSRNNDVFQVLVTSGNQGVLAAGSKVTALAPGQAGFFDYDTNLSFVAATAGTKRNFYVAVGVDSDGSGTIDDVQKSSGSHIQKKNIVHYSYRPHTPGRNMIVVLRDYTAECETEYGIKLELRNQEIYRTQGYNQFTKTYVIKTSCCSGCEPTCPSGDANEITRLLAIEINNDPTKLIVARAIARQALVAADIPGLSGNIAEGAVVSDANLAALMAYNAAATDPADFLYTDLQIETVPQALRAFTGSVNLNYFYPRETVVIATKVSGFKCTGVIETTQTARFEEGNGNDIKQKEYIALGWKVGPYRLSTLNGVAYDRQYNAVATQKYDQIALTYDQFSIGAWLEYYNNEASIVAIPATDTVTRDAFMTVLDALVTPLGFDPLADDAAASNVNPAVIEATENRTAATDGLA